jgi:hypothetical protein
VGHLVAGLLDPPTKVHAGRPAGEALLFNGFDKLLRRVASTTHPLLDVDFPDREVMVVGNSGHGVDCNAAVIQRLAWSNKGGHVKIIANQIPFAWLACFDGGLHFCSRPTSSFPRL